MLKNIILKINFLILINFKVTKSKAKVKLALNAKAFSAQYLEKFMCDRHGTW